MAQNQHTAGAFDIRNVIGGLIGLYGVILTLMGIFGDKELDKTGDVNANLWAGLIMLAFGVVFIVWARVRPVVVTEHVDQGDAEQGHGERGHVERGQDDAG